MSTLVLYSMSFHSFSFVCLIFHWSEFVHALSFHYTFAYNCLFFSPSCRCPVVEIGTGKMTEEMAAGHATKALASLLPCLRSRQSLARVTSTLVDGLHTLHLPHTSMVRSPANTHSSIIYFMSLTKFKFLKENLLVSYISPCHSYKKSFIKSLLVY